MWNFGLETQQTVTAASATHDPEVVAFARDRLGFEPDFIQERLLASGSFPTGDRELFAAVG